MILDITALAVSVVSAGFTGWGIIYARRSAKSADSSAVSAAITAGLDADRRHSELTPRFRIDVSESNPGSTTLKMLIHLTGPPELQRLDALTVTIRDDHPWRGEGTPVSGGPTPAEIKAQIWGRWQFTPGTGPGADPVRGNAGADPTGRTTPTRGLPVGEALPFFLDLTMPPRWASLNFEDWQSQMGDALRLRLVCERAGYEPWVLTAEFVIGDGGGYAETPLALK